MTFAVAGGGRVTGTFIARLPRLASELGPVAAQSYRLASRIVNSIRAGHAAKNYDELNESTLILICAPEPGLARIVSGLAESIDCRGKAILLCESGADSQALACLQSRGAKVGSIQPIPGFDGKRFVTEGDAKAVREAKRLVGQIGARVEEVRTVKMAVYSAGLSFGTSLFTPLVEASMLCLQDAGMTKASAVRVATTLFQSSLRGYIYAGKRSWSGPLADRDCAAARRELEALCASKPVLARHYRAVASLALEVLGGSRDAL